MSHFPRQIAELAAAHLPAGLFTPGAADQMIAAASRLSLAPGLGFECRLGRDGGPIDLSQRLRLADGAAAQLGELAARQVHGPDAGMRSIWRRVQAFTTLWERTPGVLREIWLEIDADGPPWPSLFLWFEGPPTDDPRAKAFVETLAGGPATAWEPMLAALETGRACGIEPGSMVGMMLSRAGALRATFHRPEPQQAMRLFEALDWQGPRELVRDILAAPCVTATTHQLVLDFLPALMPHCGVELLPPAGDIDGAWFDGVISWMVAQGWADPARTSALGEWAGALGPGQARAPWPDAMIVAALIGDSPPTVWWRRRNHLKLNLSPAAPPLAKLYLALFAEGAAQ